MTAFLFDLDMTLLDTSALAGHRARREWSAVRAGFHRVNPFPLDPPPHEIPAKLRAAGHPVAIVTSSPRWYAQKLARRFGIEADVVIGWDDTDRHKPEPEPLEKALRDLGAEARDAWYVGDDPGDVEASYRARVASIGAAWAVAALGERSKLIETAPDVWLSRPETLLRRSPNRLRYLAELACEGTNLTGSPGGLIPLTPRPQRFALGRYFAVSDARHANSALSRKLLEMKERDAPAPLFTRALLGFLEHSRWKPDAVVPVPPKPSQTRNRFEAILSRMDAELPASIRVAPTGLRRVTEGTNYKGMSPEDRAEAVRRAFISTRRWDSLRVLLLDDILTTGSTVTACAGILRAAGATEVRTVVFAKAQTPLLRKICPECSRGMRVRTNSTTGWQFWGCSGYPECQFTEDMQKECPRCGQPMLGRTNRQTRERFWGCSGYPGCRYTENA